MWILEYELDRNCQESKKMRKTAAKEGWKM
jgi:hypothetical protein